MPSASFSPLFFLSTVSDHGSAADAKSYCASSTTRRPGTKGPDSYSAATTLTTWMDSSCISSSVAYWFTRARSFTTISSMYSFSAESCCSDRREDPVGRREARVDVDVDVAVASFASRASPKETSSARVSTREGFSCRPLGSEASIVAVATRRRMSRNRPSVADDGTDASRASARRKASTGVSAGCTPTPSASFDSAPAPAAPLGLGRAASGTCACAGSRDSEPPSSDALMISARTPSHSESATTERSSPTRRPR
mmetsp:Transcript_11758/g.50380  ORF Transcript_11758/g.50380 Transcript_11758/m.50380 type:complete len:255 (+) Transcript_11758:785-1549(+)